MSGTLIEKTSHDLSLAVAANVVTCGLPSEVQEHYLANKHLIPEAILRGFILPQPEKLSVKIEPAATVSTPTLFKTADTDLNFWLAKTEEFAKKYLGVEVNLCEHFAIPEFLPWPSAIPVFDPGLNNRQAVQKALKGSGLVVWEEVDVMKYSGSQANKEPTLQFIQNSIRPNDDMMGLSPDQLVNIGKSWLDLRGYALAFALHHFVGGEHLDQQTWTWFPSARLASAKVGHGNWNPDDRKVRFGWNISFGYSDMGARLAMPISLKS